MHNAQCSIHNSPLIKWARVLFFFCVIASFSFFSCGKFKKQEMEMKAGEGKKIIYTCSMHPQVSAKKPGKCPICYMPLVPKEVSLHPENEKPKITLTSEQMTMANIKTEEVKVGDLSNALVISGHVVPDNDRTLEIVSWVNGRIEKLYVRNVSAEIKEGQLLFEIYSEELQALERDYVFAVQNKNSSSLGMNLILSAKQKLLLFGMNEEQIAELEKSLTVPNTTKIYSRYSGTVTEINAVEGMYVMQGTTLYQVVNLDALWISGEVYASDVGKIKAGQEVEFAIEGYPNEIFKGKVNYISNEFIEGTKIFPIRIAIGSYGRKIKPGMKAHHVYLQNVYKQSLYVPTSAIIDGGEMKMVYVATADTIFEPRMVQIGESESTLTTILEGLKAGEKVAVSGVFLLDSEVRIKFGMGGMGEMHEH